MTIGRRYPTGLHPSRPGRGLLWTGVTLVLILGLPPTAGLAKSPSGHPAFIPGVTDFGRKPSPTPAPTASKPTPTPAPAASKSPSHRPTFIPGVTDMRSTPQP